MYKVLVFFLMVLNLNAVVYTTPCELVIDYMKHEKYLMIEGHKFYIDYEDLEHADDCGCQKD